MRDLAQDADDRALASAVIGIGRSLGLTVIAEGVETEGQRDILVAMGCDGAQGWLFGRPMPAEALAGWIAGQA